MEWWSKYSNAIMLGVSSLAWVLLSYFQSKATRLWYRRFRDEQEHHTQTLEILRKMRKIPDDAIGFVFPSKTPDGKPTITLFGKDIQYDNSVWLSRDHPLLTPIKREVWQFKSPPGTDCTIKLPDGITVDKGKT